MKTGLKIVIQKYLSLFLIFSLIITGVFVVPGTYSVPAHAANKNRGGGHLLYTLPERKIITDVSEEEATAIKKAAKSRKISRIGEYATLLQTVPEQECYQLLLGAIAHYAPYGTSKGEVKERYSYRIPISEATYNEFYLDSQGADHAQEIFQHICEAGVYDHVDKVQYGLCEIVVENAYEIDGNYYGEFGAVALYPYNYESMNQQLKNARTRFLNSVPRLKTAKTKQEKELLIHDALIDNVTYDYGFTTRKIYTAYGALVEGNAVCDGYAQAFAYLLNDNSVDIDAMIITGGVGASESEARDNGHAWNRVKLGSEWYDVDPTWDDANDSEDEWLRHYYFNITTDEMEAEEHLTVRPYTGRLITPRAEGTTYTAYYMSDNYPELFRSTRASSIALNIGSASLPVGDTISVKATFTPDDVDNSYVKWVSSDPLVADVDGGVITAISKGKATISAIAGSNMSARSDISITVITPVTGLMLDKTEVNLRIGDTCTLTPNAIPNADDNDACIWISSDESVATVQNGVVRAVGTGVATVTATSSINNEVSASCRVTVAKESGTDITVGEGKNAFKYKVLADDVSAVTFKGNGNKKSKSIKIPSKIKDENGVEYTVKEIAKGALKGRKKLKKLTIPKTIEVIRKNAFKGCSHLNKITIDGSSLKKIETGAFSGLPKNAVIIIKASSKSKFNKLVKKIKKAGAKDVKFKWKKIS